MVIVQVRSLRQSIYLNGKELDVLPIDSKTKRRKSTVYAGAMCCIAILGILMTYVFPTSLSYDVNSSKTRYVSMDFELLKMLMFERADSGAPHKSTYVSREFQYLADCCPSDTRPIAPRGGISVDGHLLELYRTKTMTQKFLETRCRRHVVNQPCRLIDRRYKHVSQCVQRYTYVYAFVRDFRAFNTTSTDPYRFDYIRLKSGCSCHLNLTVTEEFAFSKN